jgi:SAM-dependent methyltransferase
MISTMGKVSRTGIVPRILYLDPLKPEFERIAREQVFMLPVFPISPVCIEDLTLTPADFTVIYSRNAIDHCFDPAKAIQNMASILKTGGSLVLKHYYRCADRNNHESLHQWNFFDEHGEMWLEGYGTTVSVLSLVSPCEQVAVDRYNEGPEILIRAIYRKPIL